MGYKNVQQNVRDNVYNLVEQAMHEGGIREVFSAIKSIAVEAKGKDWAKGAEIQWNIIEGLASLGENLDFPDDYLIEEE